MNADDFGLSPGVNAGVVEAHQDGILTSATMLVNAPHFSEAVELARSNPGLGVGVHLNLVRGRPLSPAGEVPDLIDRRGAFAPFRLRRLSPAFLRQAELEYRRQIERALETNLFITHVDFEKHHAWQSRLYALARRLAIEYGIGAIRNLKEPLAWSIRRLGWPGWRRALMAAALRVGVEFRASGGETPAMPDYFFGQAHIGRVTGRTLVRLARHIPPGIGELMVHPGKPDVSAPSGDMGGGWLGRAREAELAALVSPRVRSAFAENGVRLVSYRELADPELSLSRMKGKP